MTNPILKTVHIKVIRFLYYAGKNNFTCPNGLLIFWPKSLPSTKRPPIIITTLINRLAKNKLQ